MEHKLDTFEKFYPYYLAQHSNLVCRRLHFIGSCLVILLLLITLFTQEWWLLLLLPVAGYGFAWVGHFFFELNRPATFTHPIYSLMGDWVMFKDVFAGKVKL